MKGFIILYIVLLLYFPSQGKVNPKFTSIEKLVSSKVLEAEFKGSGGYSGNCIDILMRNTTQDSLFVWIEAGRRLIAEDSLIQDILIVQNQLIVLLPGAEKNTPAYGFCCQSHDHAPVKGSVFKVGYMAPESWVKLANLIDTNRLFPTSAIQSAVWVLSDNHNPASIHCSNKQLIALLRKSVSEIKNLPVAWYSITYKEDSTQLFSDKPAAVFGSLEYYVKNNCAVSINIRNHQGIVMTTLLNKVYHNPGTYTYDVEINVDRWPKDEYQVYVYEDNSNVTLIKKFNLKSN